MGSNAYAKLFYGLLWDEEDEHDGEGNLLPWAAWEEDDPEGEEGAIGAEEFMGR